jgi:hypothetical protein
VKRVNFLGHLRHGRLTVRGCTIVTVDKEGNELSRVFDKGKSVCLNLGDRVVVSNADLDVDEVASCRVETVYPDGNAGVVVVLGRVSDGSVHVMPSERAKAKNSQPKMGRVIHAPGESA